MLHFDGDGSDTQGQLIFETADGEVNPIRADKLTPLLTECGVPIMVLSAGQSASFHAHMQHPFASVATALLKAGMRSIVAMAEHFHHNAAKHFIPAFYQRLFIQIRYDQVNGLMKRLTNHLNR